MKNRVGDILGICIGENKNAKYWLGVVHQKCNSTKCVSYMNLKALMADFKRVYALLTKKLHYMN